jgi:hypothetical protein
LCQSQREAGERRIVNRTEVAWDRKPHRGLVHRTEVTWVRARGSSDVAEKSTWERRPGVSVVRRLRNDTLSSESADWKSVAAASGALPLYADMGGFLVIRDDGEILRYDPETATTKPEEDERWRLVARSAAADRFPELESLRPQRPSASRTCSACAGAGRVLEGTVRCGMCFGLGWLVA